MTDPPPWTGTADPIVPKPVPPRRPNHPRTVDEPRHHGWAVAGWALVTVAGFVLFGWLIGACDDGRGPTGVDGSPETTTTAPQVVDATYRCQEAGEAAWRCQTWEDPATGRQFRCLLTPAGQYGARSLWCYETTPPSVPR